MEIVDGFLLFEIMYILKTSIVKTVIFHQLTTLHSQGYCRYN